MSFNLSINFLTFVKPNLKRNSNTKNKNGTVEYLKSEVFYGKARVKEIQKYPKTRFEYTGSFPYTQNCADDDLSSVEKLRETGDIVHGNGIHQKRLIPLLHLDGVKNMQDANKYLENYIVEHNKHFSKQPLLGNAHKPLPDYVKSIDDVCYIIVERTLNND